MNERDLLNPFDHGFNPESALKKLATVLNGVGVVWMILCVVFFFGALLIDIDFFEDFWWLALAVLADGFLSWGFLRLCAVFIWAFGDLVGTNRRIASGSGTQANESAESFDGMLPKI